MALVTPVAMFLNYRLNHMRGKLNTEGAVCGLATDSRSAAGCGGSGGDGDGDGAPAKLLRRSAVKR